MTKTIVYNVPEEPKERKILFKKGNWETYNTGVVFGLSLKI